MSSTLKQILLLVGILLVLGAMAWIGRPSGNVATRAPIAALPQVPRASLVADMQSFDFGTISMANGIVRHAFTIKNAGSKPITIRQMYTSCMCTEATLVMPGGLALGPFGMPGHGMLPMINRQLPAGAEATVEVTFNPAAHGPAGVGRIERQIYIETDTGEPLVLQITANVTP